MRFTNILLGTALTIGLLGTGAVAARAQVREFRGGERGTAHFEGRGFDRGRGYERPVVRGYGYGGGDGVAVETPYAAGYVPPCPGDGYVWLNGGWVFRGRPGLAAGYGRGFDRGFDRGYGRGYVGSGRGFERGRR
jgi:hypothetical protein